MSATEDTATPSADAKRIADAIDMSTDWSYIDIGKLVEGVQSIADDVNRARYDGPGFDLERVMADLLGALGDIRYELEVIAMDEDGGSRIVETMQLTEPIVLTHRAIVAWAVTERGDTWPIVTSDTDPRPVIVYAWPLPPTGAMR